MEVLHISAECYPAAKVGGLADVVGALPKYQNKGGIAASVIIPKYDMPWIAKQKFTIVNEGEIFLYHEQVPYTIEQYEEDDLGFPLYVVNIPGKFDRPGVYADEAGNWYKDEAERYITFQRAILTWLLGMEEKPKIIHCHDHHTGLVPFLVKYAYEFQPLKDIPTVFTIHNGVYHGTFSWQRMYLLPPHDIRFHGLLDWNDSINPLATAIKCCWKLTTVSPGYLSELKQKSAGLEWLFRNEAEKSTGILNGIDTQVWNPKTDKLLAKNMSRSIEAYKKQNKKILTDQFNLDPKLPLFTFIGRLVAEKGADLLPSLISNYLQNNPAATFIILGSGEPSVERMLEQLPSQFKNHVGVSIQYNEALAHQLYAGSDFLLMPSRVEPCGLNQLYALRYGTVPVVRSVGGLKDTIIDLNESTDNGRGIRFDNLNVTEGLEALSRAVELYDDGPKFIEMRKRIMALDFSWENSAEKYANIYNQLI